MGLFKGCKMSDDVNGIFGIILNLMPEVSNKIMEVLTTSMRWQMDLVKLTMWSNIV